MGMTAKSLVRISFLITLSFGSVAMAQTDPGAASAASPAATTEAQPPKRDSLMPQPAIGTLVQNNGGSLARAELTNQPTPTTAGQFTVSYFAVPEPQPRLIHKHDLITIVIREDSNFSSNGETNTQHSSDFDAAISDFIKFHPSRFAIQAFAPNNPLELKANSSRDAAGQATVDRTDTFTARITANVVDVKPNGTLVLEASKDIKTDEEEQLFTLVGTCRVDDVTADNTVLSNQMSDLKLIKKHTGAVRDATERGFIPRLLDSLNPF